MLVTRTRRAARGAEPRRQRDAVADGARRARTASRRRSPAFDVPARRRSSCEPPAPGAVHGGGPRRVLERRAAEISRHRRPRCSSAPVPTSCCSARSMSAWPARATGTPSPISPARLGAGYVFGVEFVELGLGDAARAGLACGPEQPGRSARRGHPVPASALCGRRWPGSRPRAAGSTAHSASGGSAAGSRSWPRSRSPATPVLFVSAHYESHSDPADRLVQTRTLLDAIDALAPDTPVLIAGDFNTSTFALAEKDRRCGDRSRAGGRSAVASWPRWTTSRCSTLLRASRLRLAELQRRARADTAHPARRHAGATLRQDRLAVCARPALHRPRIDSGRRWRRAAPSPTMRRWPSPWRPPEEARCRYRPLAREVRPHPCLRPSRPQRRRAGEHPAGLLAAAERGATVCEIDVVLTRDDEIVLLHDEILDRTTNGRGRVADYDLAALRRLDAGSWFAASFAGTRVPTLAEALATARANGMGLLVEIKERQRADRMIERLGGGPGRRAIAGRRAGHLVRPSVPGARQETDPGCTHRADHPRPPCRSSGHGDQRQVRLRSRSSGTCSALTMPEGSMMLASPCGSPCRGRSACCCANAMGSTTRRPLPKRCLPG